MAALALAPLYRNLGCEVRTLNYDFRTKVGSLDIQTDTFCDMEAAIALFESLDPEARLIQCFAGDRTHARYRLTPAGTWVAEQPKAN
jgi:hypothetical protein